MLKLLAFSGLALLALSCGSGSNPVSHVDMVGGQPVREGSPAYTATVSLSKSSKLNGIESFCSGTLIAPNLVLTAAHCVESFANPSQFFVLFGNSDKDPNSVTRAVQSFATYLPKDGSRYFPNFDIAWVKMEQDAPAEYQPAEILRSSVQLQTVVGKTDSLLLAGYGYTKTDCPSDPTCSGTRLQVQTYLRRFINTTHFAQLMVIGPKQLSGSCTGDSGGSAFTSINGRWYVLGDLNGKNLTLNTSAVWDRTKLCDSGESIYTFAGAYVDWLQKSSGVTLQFDDVANPKGPGLLPVDAPASLGTNPDLAAMLRYNNPDDPLWITSDALTNAFGDENKRTIPDLGQVVTDPVRAAAAMAKWDSFKFTGVFFDITARAVKDRQLSDLRPILRLKELAKLELVSNRLTDVTPLGQLKNLQELTLGNNYDFTTKAKLPYDFRFLASLPKLKVLNLATNSGNLELTKIPWASLSNLEVLNLSSNDTVNLGLIPTATLAKLTTLVVQYGGLTDISALAAATNLRNLDLKNNTIQDISVLAKLQQLQVLELNYNKIEDFSPISGLKELKQLKAQGNPQKDKVCPAAATCTYD